MLDRDLEEAEEQIQVALRTHLKAVDGLIDTQDARLLSLEAAFSAGHSSLHAEFAAEREAILARVARDRTEIQDVVTTVELDELHAVAETKQVRARACVRSARGDVCCGVRSAPRAPTPQERLRCPVQEHDQTREMIKNRNLESIHVLQSFLDSRIEDLERNFEAAHLTYLQVWTA